MSKELIVNLRSETGKDASSRSRKSGHIPAVLYGKGSENVLLSAPFGEIDAAKPQKGDVVTLMLDGQKIEAQIMEIQINVLKSHVLHIDFKRI